jgi:hypothetical protein
MCCIYRRAKHSLSLCSSSFEYQLNVSKATGSWTQKKIHHHRFMFDNMLSNAMFRELFLIRPPKESILVVMRSSICLSCSDSMNRSFFATSSTSLDIVDSPKTFLWIIPINSLLLQNNISLCTSSRGLKPLST